MGFPGALLVQFLVLFLFLLHLAEVVHRLQRKVLYSQVSQRLHQLRKGKFGVNRRGDVLGLDWHFLLHFVLDLRVIVVLFG